MPENRLQPEKLTVIEEVGYTEQETNVDEWQTMHTDVHIYPAGNRTRENQIPPADIMEEKNAERSIYLVNNSWGEKNFFGKNTCWTHYYKSVFDKAEKGDFRKATSGRWQFYTKYGALFRYFAIQLYLLNN